MEIGPVPRAPFETELVPVARTWPPVMEMPPEKVEPLLPRLRMPVLDLTNDPLPESAPLRVWVAVVPMARALLLMIAPEWVPLLRRPPPETWKVPAEMVTSPLWVLAELVRLRVPVPILFTSSVPENTPLKVTVFAPVLTAMPSQAICTGLARVMAFSKRRLPSVPLGLEFRYTRFAASPSPVAFPTTMAPRFRLIVARKELLPAKRKVVVLSPLTLVFRNNVVLAFPAVRLPVRFNSVPNAAPAEFLIRE
jgi:hypothetical protein